MLVLCLRASRVAKPYLDGAVVNEKTIELGEGLAGAVCVVERHLGNALAVALGAVREIHLLDLTNRALEVFLSRGFVVSDVRREFADLRGRK
jgi:hypothetical protein